MTHSVSRLERKERRRQARPRGDNDAPGLLVLVSIVSSFGSAILDVRKSEVQKPTTGSSTRNKAQNQAQQAQSLGKEEPSYLQAKKQGHALLISQQPPPLSSSAWHRGNWSRRNLADATMKPRGSHAEGPTDVIPDQATPHLAPCSWASEEARACVQLPGAEDRLSILLRVKVRLGEEGGFLGWREVWLREKREYSIA